MDWQAEFESALSYEPFLQQFASENDRRKWADIYDKLQLTDEQGLAGLTVDVGIPINLLLPKDEVRSLALFVGDDVQLLFPEEAVQIF